MHTRVGVLKGGEHIHRLVERVDYIYIVYIEMCYKRAGNVVSRWVVVLGRLVDVVVRLEGGIGVM